MDATRIIEEYEANHPEHTYSIEPERVYLGLVTRGPDTLEELYSPRWAESQIEFMEAC